jgi:outer membrane cobalamin receptor
VGAYEKDSSSQLPMVPAVHLNGTWETDFRIPVKAWSSVDYLSKRNIDRAGAQSLGNVFLVNAGASTNVIPKIVIAGEVKNLFDVNYEWWNGYRAPGIEFNVTAKFNLQ